MGLTFVACILTTTVRGGTPTFFGMTEFVRSFTLGK
jgi:hypothetical protein